jgi:hypothetical protein
MNENLITFNFRNTVTVFLMFLVSWAILALGIRLFAGNRSGAVGAGEADGHEKNLGTASRVGGYANG